VIGLVALVLGASVGAGVGVAARSNTTTRFKTNTVTTQAQAQTITRTVTAAPKTTTQVRVRTVTGPTSTVTQTVRSATPAPTPQQANAGSGRGGAGGQTFTGDGAQNLGTVAVDSDSILSWQCSSCSSMDITSDPDADGNNISVSSQNQSGQAAVTAGSYNSVQVNADGPWTVTINGSSP
jgi:hypothetical protein